MKPPLGLDLKGMKVDWVGTGKPQPSQPSQSPKDGAGGASAPSPDASARTGPGTAPVAAAAAPDPGSAAAPAAAPTVTRMPSSPSDSIATKVPSEAEVQAAAQALATPAPATVTPAQPQKPAGAGGQPGAAAAAAAPAPGAAAGGAAGGGQGVATSAAAAGPGKAVAPAGQPGKPAAMPIYKDTEFLPAALEILVTPPSPVAMKLIGLITAIVLAGLAWSWFGWLDIHAVAPGKLQPSGRSKVVQPLEPGKVVAIHVENGQRVEAGALLIELDPTETTAERDSMGRELEAASAEASRRTAAVAGAATPTLQPLPINFADHVTASVRRREEAVLAADLAQLRATRTSLSAQLAEKRATKQRLEASIAARARLIDLSRERVTMRQAAEGRGALSRALIIESLQQLEQHVTTDVGERGQLLETDAAAAAIDRKMEEAVTQFTAEQLQKLAEAERRRDRLEQEVIKARSKSDRTVMRAPIAGHVQQLNVTTIGQVVTSGQSLLTVVPSDAVIEAEALIANKDIGFVAAGLHAVVKVEAFPFTRYGVIEAEVVKVSRDAVEDREASAMTDAAGAARPQNPSGPMSRAQNLVFPATLRLAKRSLLIDGKEVPLTPGMAITVEIKTGQRRAIDYVLSPLREVLGGSGKER